MASRNGNATGWLVAILVLAGLLWTTGSQALDDNDVKQLSEKCEAAREEALAPIRAQRAQKCIEQQLREPDHCERYYRTYGNVSVIGAQVPTTGYFYDLPECVEWLDARNELKASRSRN